MATANLEAGGARSSAPQTICGDSTRRSVTWQSDNFSASGCGPDSSIAHHHAGERRRHGP